MSHFTQIRTQIVDQEALVRALADVGYAQVEVHAQPVPLHGFQGDNRRQRAHVVIRRKHVGRLSNDVGFERTPDGTYRAWISDLDVRRHGAGWMAELRRRYAYHATRRTLTQRGFAVADEQHAADGSVRMVLRRYA